MRTLWQQENASRTIGRLEQEPDHERDQSHTHPVVVHDPAGSCRRCRPRDRSGRRVASAWTALSIPPGRAGSSRPDRGPAFLPAECAGPFAPCPSGAGVPPPIVPAPASVPAGPGPAPHQLPPAPPRAWRHFSARCAPMARRTVLRRARSSSAAGGQGAAEVAFRSVDRRDGEPGRGRPARGRERALRRRIGKAGAGPSRTGPGPVRRQPGARLAGRGRSRAAVGPQIPRRDRFAACRGAGQAAVAATSSNAARVASQASRIEGCRLR